jgi:hypothetical protein
MKNAPVNPRGAIIVASDWPPATKCISAEIAIVAPVPPKESVVTAEPGLPLS